MYKTVFTLLLILVVQASAFYEKGNVVKLTKDNFAETVFQNKLVWVVEFYAPWCGHCKAFAPEFSKAADKLVGLGVHVGAVNCDEHRELCSNFKVEGFPTVHIFESELKEVDKKKNAYAKPSKPYNGQRTAGAVVAAALAEVPNIVKRVKSADLKDILADQTTRELPKCIVFTDKSKTSDLTKGLGLEFFNAMVVVETLDKELAAEYNVKDFPSIVVLPPGDAAPQMFDGIIKRETVFSWLLKFVNPKQKQEQPKKKETKAEEPADPLLGKLVEVKTHADYSDICGKAKSMCVLAFLDPQSDEFAGNKKLLGEMAKVYSNNKVFFGFTDGPLHIDVLETYFRDININFPSVVTIANAKNVYFGMQTSLTQKHFSSYLDGILRGSRNVKYNDIKQPIQFPEVARPPMEVLREESSGSQDATHTDL